MIPELAKILSTTVGQSLYIKCQPEVFDFTDKLSINELIFCLSDKSELKLVLNEESLHLILSMLRLSVFKKDVKIIFWNWKNFASYVLAKTGKPYLIDGAIIDLKVIESYVGKKFKAPKNLIEALNRLKDIITSGIWKEIEPIYKNLHLPLITTVLPQLESIGIIDSNSGNKLHAFYEINGQENGRLRCAGSYKNSFIPHAMKPETRKALKPRSQDELFMLFDFKGMEVFMLAWMSKDPLLQDLCKEQDVYFALCQKILDEKKDRELAKKFFLPVIYGQSAHSLSERCDINLSVAEKIVERIYALFPVALTFIESYQKQLQELGYAKDIFGKRRIFEDGKEYSVRNFAVQAPAAVVCLEKLINLYFAFKDKTDIVYTVHDGYVVYAKKDNWKNIYKTGQEALSSESKFCPGLYLKFSCSAGRNLDSLKRIG